MQSLPAIMTNSNIKDYTVERLNKNNLEDLVVLHKAVYGKEPAPGYFPKKYNTAYTGAEFAGFIAYNERGMPVAYYGVIPCFIQYGKEILLAAQSADTMTHPQYRYKGMFVDLSKLTFVLCRDLSIRLIFGFPNRNSYPGMVNRLGWIMTESMDCFSIPAGGIPFVSLAERISILKKFYKRHINFILEKYSTGDKGLAGSIIQENFIAVCRNEDYMQYKTYNPARVIKIGNAKAWITLKNCLLIGDMEFPGEENFIQVINELKKISRRLGATQIQFHCSPGTKLHSLFASHYKARPSYPVLFQDFGSGIPLTKIKFTFADIDIF